MWKTEAWCCKETGYSWERSEAIKTNFFKTKWKAAQERTSSKTLQLQVVSVIAAIIKNLTRKSNISAVFDIFDNNRNDSNREMVETRWAAQSEISSELVVLNKEKTKIKTGNMVDKYFSVISYHSILWKHPFPCDFYIVWIKQYH